MLNALQRGSLFLRTTGSCADISHHLPTRAFRSRSSSTSIGGNSKPFVTLDDKRSKFCRKGCPVVYATGVTDVIGEPEPGSDVLVKDSKGSIIGRGFYNPHSQYRVRIIALSAERDLFKGSIKDVIEHRIRTARTIRAALNLPSSCSPSSSTRDGEETSVYRLINSEGDSLSGLIVDVIGKSVVVQSLALWSELHRPTIERVLKNELLHDYRIIWRRNATRLVDEGIRLDTSVAATDATGVIAASEKEIFQGESIDEEQAEIVYENGLRYFTYPASGQKTGFYCDQRVNRKLIGSYCKGKNVLDMYCFNGGFSLNALRAGANSVLAVDSSNIALAALRQNLELNKELLRMSNKEGESTCNIEIMQSDADAAVKRLLKDENRRFDVVICDPPKLAPSVASLARATKKYIALNANTMKLVGGKGSSGGLLFTCTCSAAMTQSGRFVTDVLQPAARLANKRLSVLSIEGAAPDHTVLGAYPDGKYFEGVLCWISPL